MGKEEIQTYGLASIGLIQGLNKYYLRPEITAKRGWLAIGAVVLAHEALCASGETLSEGVDKALLAHPLLTTATIAYTAAHLANRLPENLDLFHQVTKFRG